MSAADVSGEVIEDVVVPARAPWSAVVEAGDILRLIDLEGSQAIDFLCFAAADPSERYHAPNTIKAQGNVFLGLGTVLRSSRARPLMTIIADSFGRHDTLFGCCSFEIDQVRYGRTNIESCQRNFERELARRGVGPEHVTPNANFFMRVPIAADGTAEIVESGSPPGSYVDLRAERAVLAVLSNCPQELNPASGENGPTPIRAIVYRPSARRA